MAIAVCLGGCSHLHLSQDESEAVVRVGSYDSRNDSPRPLQVKDYVGRYVPYAILAARAYDPLDSTRRVPPHSSGFIDDKDVDWSAAADRWLQPWRFEFGDVGPLCQGDDKSCGVPGLEYQVWTRRSGSGRCSEVVLAFRGTDANSLGDWLSNLHWIVRLSGVNDQYRQVQTFTESLVARIRRLPCVGPATPIVTVGHSLGGGLAHQAAYMSSDIRKVHAFDTSFVTGSTDPASNYEQTRRGLKIERAYEHGEVLAILYYILRQAAPPPGCNPQIRRFRVDLLQGSPIFQHNMKRLAAGFIRVAGRPYDPAHAKPLPGPTAADLAACGEPPTSTTRFAS